MSTALLAIWRDVTAKGVPLPSEAELVKTLGVSRPMVREALIRMEGDGLISRHQGSATYTNPEALEMPARLDRAIELSDRLAALGYDVELELLSADVLRSEELDLPQLMLDPGVLVVRTVKRWWVDGVTAVTATDHIPVRRGIGSPECDFSRSVIELTEEIGLGAPDWLCTWPTAVQLDEDEAARMGMRVGAAAMRMDQIGVERHGRHVFHAEEHHRPGVIRYGLIRTVQR